MPCYHPLTMYEHKTAKTDKGKKVIKPKPYGNIEKWKTIEVPCGQCIGCRLEYSKQWATRIILESKLYEWNWFITLTYAVPPTVPHIDKNTGEYIDMMTLKKKDVQDFMKRLREHFRKNYNHTNIRFYLCGEYGDEYERPHYHAIIFNLPLPKDDLKPYFINKEHQQIYISKIIQDCWGHGITSVGEVTYQSAAYVARYILKKQKGKENELSRLPEFTQMSLKPGIGTQYYDLKKEDIMKYDEVLVPVRGGKIATLIPPKYFDKLTERENPRRYTEIKAERLLRAQESRQVKFFQTTNEEHMQRAIAERNMIAKANKLKRGMTNI